MRGLTGRYWEPRRIGRVRLTGVMKWTFNCLVMAGSCTTRTGAVKTKTYVIRRHLLDGTTSWSPPAL